MPLVLYGCANNQVKEDEMGGHIAQMVEKRNAYRLLVGKTEGKEITRKTKTWVGG
jgi:hypothetical protein